MVATRKTEQGPHLRLVEADQASDADLVERFREGSREAFTLLVDRHQRVALAVVRRFCADADAARELAQRAFVRAFEVLGRRPGLGRESQVPFRAWVLRIALNLAKNDARDERARPGAPLEAAHAVADGALSAEDRLSAAEDRRALRRAILDLPRRQREALTLRIDGELSFKEIAGLLSTTENNAKVLFHHAVRRLRSTAGKERTR